jgi:hypothetical protein
VCVVGCLVLRYKACAAVLKGSFGLSLCELRFGCAGGLHVSSVRMYQAGGEARGLVRLGSGLICELLGESMHGGPCIGVTLLCVFMGWRSLGWVHAEVCGMQERV